MRVYASLLLSVCVVCTHLFELCTAVPVWAFRGKNRTVNRDRFAQGRNKNVFIFTYCKAQLCLNLLEVGKSDFRLV